MSDIVYFAVIFSKTTPVMGSEIITIRPFCIFLIFSYRSFHHHSLPTSAIPGRFSPLGLEIVKSHIVTSDVLVLQFVWIESLSSDPVHNLFKTLKAEDPQQERKLQINESIHMMILSQIFLFRY